MKDEALRLAHWLERDGANCQAHIDAAAELRRLHAENGALLEALKDTTVHLVAAVSLLERGGKKAAASDAMFSMMLADYEKSFEVGRAAIKAVEGETK
jgi:hypothetical protein